ncbi:MAG: hypothetical protein AB1657_02435 [Candidatus Micrarchaeota archaeon]
MQAMHKARELCERGRIKAFYFSKQEPVEEKNPERMLACLFTAAFVQHGNPVGVEFKSPLQVKVETDFEPLLRRVPAGSKLGVQIGNPSVAIATGLRKYASKYKDVIEKRKNGQQLSEHEGRIALGFEGTRESGIRRLDLALYHQRILNAMASIGLTLAGVAERRGIQSVVSICPDNEASVDSTDISKPNAGLVLEYTKRLAAWLKLIERIYGAAPETAVYLQSDLACATRKPDDAELCYCDFCMGRPCPGKASDAVQQLLDKGCNVVVNFYIENEGFHTGSYVHFERIERGMLHRTMELGDATMRCNVYFGTNRGFMVIHEPFREEGCT